MLIYTFFLTIKHLTVVLKFWTYKTALHKIIKVHKKVRKLLIVILPVVKRYNKNKLLLLLHNSAIGKE